jgi:hypothetical protein
VLIEAFTTADRQRFPVTGRLLEFFEAKARAIQQGDCEYIPSEEWLGVHWPADEYALVDLVTSFRIELFYDEARTILRELVAAASAEADLQLVDDAVRLNAALLKVPFEVDDLELTLSYDVWECHQDLIAGRRRAPARAAAKYRITRTRPLWLSAESWCEDVLGRSNRKQAFLYPIDAIPSLVPNAHTTAIQAGVHGAPPPAAPGSAH